MMVDVVEASRNANVRTEEELDLSRMNSNTFFFFCYITVHEEPGRIFYLHQPRIARTFYLENSGNFTSLGLYESQMRVYSLTNT